VAMAEARVGNRQAHGPRADHEHPGYDLEADSHESPSSVSTAAHETRGVPREGRFQTIRAAS
jgi:hypothetical protein